MDNRYKDWGEASEKYDELRYNILGSDLASANEAQTRYDVIDRFLRDLLGWQHGQISVEEHASGPKAGYVDYVLRVADFTVVVEAKRAGASFPTPTRKTQLKLKGSVLGQGDIAAAIAQAQDYAVEKSADVVVVTNGTCWCYFGVAGRTEDSFATLLFPVDTPSHAQQLFETLGEVAVESGSLRALLGGIPLPENRLINAFQWVDTRIGRNSIADAIMPALEKALYAEAILADAEQLERCFVKTEARTKYDATLGIHLGDSKQAIGEEARRVRKGNEHGPLERVVSLKPAKYAPPVTLVIGPVGAGKSTYLKHFELVVGRAALASKESHWIYVDFEAMGKDGNPRAFLYANLLRFLQREEFEYRQVVEPAYDQDIRAWARGPLAPIITDKAEFNREVAKRIAADFDKIEPYVDKVLGHLATKTLCVIVLDNSDLYEDEELETRVFAEGLALSRRLQCHVVVSLRDATFVRHRTDSAFDAYELNKLWIDPPPLKAVISSRLTYSRSILKGVDAKIPLPNGMVLNVPDLSVFFEIVQRSILNQTAGDFVDAVADGNIRRGLSLVRNFLTSGHIQADRALKIYIQEGQTDYRFPFHEVYKGTMLGQWVHFREDRAESLNVFDSRLGSRRLRLLRQLLLNDLMLRAQSEHSLDVGVGTCLDVLAPAGVSVDHLLRTLGDLHAQGLVRNQRAEPIGVNSTISITRSGAYYSRHLCNTFVYVEECMFDTAIEDAAVWAQLHELTSGINAERYAAPRMEHRRERIEMFLDYLCALESETLNLLPGADHLASLQRIKVSVMADVNDAVARTKRREAEVDH